MGGRLVEHQHRRRCEQRAGRDDPQRLAAGKLALLPDEGVEPIWQQVTVQSFRGGPFAMLRVRSRRYAALAARSVGAMKARMIHRIGKINPIQNSQ